MSVSMPIDPLQKGFGFRAFFFPTQEDRPIIYRGWMMRGEGGRLLKALASQREVPAGPGHGNVPKIDQSRGAGKWLVIFRQAGQ